MYKIPRPAYHFTPPANWLNDPNGLVYHAGEYHLFYQHYPHSLDRGPMHWGHAVSTDLVNWQHLPIALHPDEIGMIFSGSAVVDKENTAGFGANAMIAAFTHHHERSESQSLAYSLDHGRSWTKYAQNPIIPAPNPPGDFRDPKIFWHRDHWVMLLVAGRALLIYSSPNLREWTEISRFSDGLEGGSLWETPELFELPIRGTDEMRWVLMVGVNKNAIAGGSGTQYFIGNFDGERFTLDPKIGSANWVDHGPDFYAPQTWNNEPHNRRICIAWMNNWHYATKIPANNWRGTLTLPRELSLTQTAKDIRLAQQPIVEIETLRRKHISFDNLIVQAGENPLKDLRATSYEIFAKIELTAQTPSFGFHLRKGADEETTILCHPQDSEINVDRRHSGQTDFTDTFAAIHTIPFFTSEILKLHIFVDSHSLEIFINDGIHAYTANIFPNPQSANLEFFVKKGSIHLIRLDFYHFEEKI